MDFKVQMYSSDVYCANGYILCGCKGEIFTQFSKSEFVNQSILGADVVVVNGRVE